MQEFLGNSLTVQHPVNTAVDSHERRISHSLYETINSSDGNSTPLPVRRAGEFWPLLHLFFLFPSKSNVLAWVISVPTCLPHAQLDIYSPQSICPASAWLASSAGFLKTPLPSNLPPHPPTFSSQYYFTIEISQGLTSSPILPAFTPLHACFSRVNSYFTKVDISG